jgi:hypothetical protein
MIDVVKSISIQISEPSFFRWLNILNFHNMLQQVIKCGMLVKVKSFNTNLVIPLNNKAD